MTADLHIPDFVAGTDYEWFDEGITFIARLYEIPSSLMTVCIHGKIGTDGNLGGFVVSLTGAAGEKEVWGKIQQRVDEDGYTWHVANRANGGSADTAVVALANTVDAIKACLDADAPNDAKRRKSRVALMKALYARVNPPT